MAYEVGGGGEERRKKKEERELHWRDEKMQTEISFASLYTILPMQIRVCASFAFPFKPNFINATLRSTLLLFDCVTVWIAEQ